MELQQVQQKNKERLEVRVKACTIRLDSNNLCKAEIAWNI